MPDYKFKITVWFVEWDNRLYAGRYYNDKADRDVFLIKFGQKYPHADITNILDEEVDD